MALKTLTGVEKINGENISVTDDQNTEYSGMLPTAECPIIADQNTGVISFKIQDGPIKEVGKNGCQVTELIAVAHKMIDELNKKFQCTENDMTLHHLSEALRWQAERTANRIAKGVEGKSEN